MIGKINAPSTRQSTKIYFNSQKADIIIPRLFDYRSQVAANYLFKNYPIVSGHFHINKNIIHSYKEKYNFITILRDPVERFISHYKYNKVNNNDLSFRHK